MLYLLWYYTCSPQMCCAVEHGITCCALCYSAIATLTLPHTRLVTHQLTQQSTIHTNGFPNPWGPGCAPEHTQGIIYRSIWGLSYMLRRALSLCIIPTLDDWMLQPYWTRDNIQWAQHINTKSNSYISVTHGCPYIASTSLQLH